MTVLTENREDCVVDGSTPAGEGVDGSAGDFFCTGAVGGGEGCELVLNDGAVALNEEFDRVDSALALCLNEGWGVEMGGCVSSGHNRYACGLLLFIVACGYFDDSDT